MDGIPFFLRYGFVRDDLVSVLVKVSPKGRESVSRAFVCLYPSFPSIYLAPLIRRPSRHSFTWPSLNASHRLTGWNIRSYAATLPFSHFASQRDCTSQVVRALLLFLPLLFCSFAVKCETGARSRGRGPHSSRNYSSTTS